MSRHVSLAALGFSSFFADAFALHAKLGRTPARVIAEHRGAYRVRGEDGEVWAKPSGKLRHDALSPLDLPAVGDWVALEGDHAHGYVIQAILPRKTHFVRRAAGPEKKPQAIAANVDWVFLVSSLNRDFSPRRFERYLALARESGAQPVLLLSKADLGDAEKAKEEVLAIAPNVPIHAISSVTGEGVELVRGYLHNHATGVLLGSSGVGKSTLINRLLGEERLLTASVRDDDDKGRHTTVHRELVLLPEGGVLIDTPGMREIGLWDSSAGVEETFDEIAAVAASCRFSDCSHEKEPGCAVRAAVEAGTISKERAASYKALVEEGERKDARSDPRIKMLEARKNRAQAKALRAHTRRKRG